MNNYHKIIYLCEEYPSVLISINMFTDLISFIGYSNSLIEPQTNRSILMSGHYASCNKSKIYVSNIVAPNNFRYSKQVDPNSKLESDWSPRFNFDDDIGEIEKYKKLEVFW